VGLSEEFCRVAQDENLDDISSAWWRAWAACWGFATFATTPLGSRKEQSIRRFRQLALAHGLRSVVAISLQAKEQAFGVAPSRDPDSRRFTAAELRLLLALGHQIAWQLKTAT